MSDADTLTELQRLLRAYDRRQRLDEAAVREIDALKAAVDMFHRLVHPRGAKTA